MAGCSFGLACLLHAICLVVWFLWLAFWVCKLAVKLLHGSCYQIIGATTNTSTYFGPTDSQVRQTKLISEERGHAHPTELAGDTGTGCLLVSFTYGSCGIPT